MNEEIEYAEMLEIPVSTVNVVKKRRRRKIEKPEVFHTQPDAPQNTVPVRAQAETPANDPLSDSVIARINERVQENEPSEITADAELFAESANSEGRLDFDVPDRIDTVRVYTPPKTKRFFFRRKKKLTPDFELKEEFDNDFSDFDEQGDMPLFQTDEQENDEGRYATNNEEPKPFRIAMAAEFTAACALCGAIFLTNVFLPDSAINTFFRALHGGNVQTADTRTYADFQLTPIVSELSNAKIQLSPTGILSFTDECCVYPAANGTIREILQSQDGTYRITIDHSEYFSEVISGLDHVYYATGDEVKNNIPVGYSEGESEVQVTMYDQGELLNCFSLNEENRLVWIEQSEE